jgi:SAM-dependent methyltransferase
MAYTLEVEISGEKGSEEQLSRLCNRYYWAADYCADKDVLEVACGSGQGLACIAKTARSVEAGDYSQELVDVVSEQYRGRINVIRFDAHKLPFLDSTKDVILLFEAIYYLQDPISFLRECRRILRPGGILLIVTANKDLYDFNASRYAVDYYGVVELAKMLSETGYSGIEMYGDYPYSQTSMRQRILRPIKKMAVMLNIMPKSKIWKNLLKPFVFGKMIALPREISFGLTPRTTPQQILLDVPDRRHKVLYCAARSF